jgi:hypothetical protein
MEARLDPSNPSGYALVANLGSLPSGSEFHFTPNLSIRPASTAERAELHSLIEYSYPHKWVNRFECQVNIEQHSPTQHTQRFTRLPDANWRYVVLAFEGSNGPIHQLVQASYMTDLLLELGFEAGNAAGAAGYSLHGALARALAPELCGDDLPIASVAQLEDLRSVHGRLERHDHGSLDLTRPLQEFGNLLELPTRSPLRLLGYFAVLESLLTHAPKPSDPYDSLTRQVKTKLNLIFKRSLGPVLQPTNLGTLAHDKLWGTLYSLRSCVAHGTHPDFDKGDFRPLGDLPRASALVQAATTVVLRAALEEPQLVADLKLC